MKAVKSRDTGPELSLRRALWGRGFRYRLHVKSLPGSPDLVFHSRRLALFIDGDYWHGRQWKKRGFASLTEQMSRVNNAEYWIKKIEGNMRRDRRVTRQLKDQGWRVLRVWESDLKKHHEHTITGIVTKLRTS